MDLISLVTGSTTIASALLAAAAKNGISEFFSRRSSSDPQRTAAQGNLQDPVVRRLEEVKSMLRAQRRKAALNRWASGLLTFGQFIIGGMLATEFVQQEFPKGYVGVLGLIVLLSSLVRQHWRPEVQYVGARQRAQVLGELVRRVQDQFDLDTVNGATTDKAMLVEWLSGGMTSVERSEIEEQGKLFSEVGAKTASKKPAVKSKGS